MFFAAESDNKQSVNDLGGSSKPNHPVIPCVDQHLSQLHSRNLLPLTQNFPFSAQHQGFAAECPGQGTPQPSLGRLSIPAFLFQALKGCSFLFQHCFPHFRRTLFIPDPPRQLFNPLALDLDKRRDAPGLREITERNPSKT